MKEKISPAARVMAAVDTYDAVVTGRSRRDGMPLKKAFEILNNEAKNDKLDIVVVGHLIKIVSGSL